MTKFLSSPTENAPAKPPKSDPVDTLLHVGSIPAALVPGYFATEISIRRGAYKNLARHGLFNPEQAERNKEYTTIFERVAKGEAINPAAEFKWSEGKYRALVKNKFESMGLHGLSDYWKILARNQKLDALVLGATVSGIALGATLAVANMRDWAKYNARVNGDEDSTPSRH